MYVREGERRKEEEEEEEEVPSWGNSNSLVVQRRNICCFLTTLRLHNRREKTIGERRSRSVLNRKVKWLRKNWIWRNLRKIIGARRCRRPPSWPTTAAPFPFAQLEAFQSLRLSQVLSLSSRCWKFSQEINATWKSRALSSPLLDNCVQISFYVVKWRVLFLNDSWIGVLLCGLRNVAGGWRPWQNRPKEGSWGDETIRLCRPWCLRLDWHLWVFYPLGPSLLHCFTSRFITVLQQDLKHPNVVRECWSPSLDALRFCSKIWKM